MRWSRFRATARTLLPCREHTTLVPLVYACNSSSGAANVIQNRFSHRHGHLKPLHVCGDGATKVVENEVLNCLTILQLSHFAQQSRMAFAKPIDASVRVAFDWEELVGPIDDRQFVDQLKRQGRQWNQMRFSILRSR